MQRLIKFRMGKFRMGKFRMGKFRMGKFRMGKFWQGKLGPLSSLSVPLSLSKKAASFILLLSLSSIGAWAQGGGIAGQVVQPSPPVGTGGPAANAPVLICPSTASGTPCSPAASVYSDPALTQLVSAPATDIYGNYSFFVAPGYYIVQISPIPGNAIVYPYLIFAGTGTVTSLTFLVPNIFSLNGGAGCVITTSGTCNVTLVSQSQNVVFAGPNGFAGLPAFRSLVPADLASQAANTVVGNCTTSSAVPTACLLTAAMIPSTLNATTFSGTISGTALSLSGGASMSSLSVTSGGTASFSGPAIVTGQLTANGGLLVSGVTSMFGFLGVTGTGTFSGLVAALNFNASTGYEIAGSYGTAGQLFVSTGSGTGFTNANVLGQAAVASIVAGSAAGAGSFIEGTAVCAVGATCLDNGGVVTVTTGSSVSGLGVFTISFGATHVSNACTITPFAGTAAPPANMLTQGDNGTAFAVTLFTTGSPLVTGTTYTWSYTCTFH